MQGSESCRPRATCKDSENQVKEGMEDSVFRLISKSAASRGNRHLEVERGRSKKFLDTCQHIKLVADAESCDPCSRKPHISSRVCVTIA